MLAVTMILTGMRGGITLSAALEGIYAETPKYRITDAALMHTHGLLYQAMVDNGIDTGTDYRDLTPGELTLIASKALDIHLG